MKTRKIFLTALTAILLVTSYSVVAGTKPDPVPNPPLQVREANVDGTTGLIRVHEEGTAKVEVQGVADVNVTGGSLEVTIACAAYISRVWLHCRGGPR